MAERIRVGILGAGMAGKAHATAFSRLPDVDVTALWSRTRAHAEKVAGELNLTEAQVYDDWRELVEGAEVDVIAVTTPPMLRCAPVAMALERGLHVLVEKPLSIELGESQEMVRLAQGASTVTATCFDWRYSPGIQVGWREVQAGRIGRLLDIHMVNRVSNTPRAFLTRWPWEAETSTGFLGGVGSHSIDRIRFVAGTEFARLIGRVVPFCPRAGVRDALRCRHAPGRVHWGGIGPTLVHDDDGAVRVALGPPRGGGHPGSE
jgi:predicted dehydrogenase